MTVAYFVITADVTVAGGVATVTPTAISTDAGDVVSSLYGLVQAGGWVSGPAGHGIVASVSSGGVIVTAAAWSGDAVSGAKFTVQSIPTGTASIQTTAALLAAFNAENAAASSGARILASASSADSLTKIDALSDCYLVSMAQTAPPTAPVAGDAYLVAVAATGAWAGYDGKIAYYVGSAWQFYAPYRGLTAYNAADGKTYRYTGSAWAEVSVDKVSGYPLTLTAALSVQGGYPSILRATAATDVTLPTSGTLAVLDRAQNWSRTQSITNTTVESATVVYGLSVTNSPSSGTANTYGVQTYVYASDSSLPSNQLIGFLGQDICLHASGTIPNVFGMQVNVQNRNSGNITNAYGVYAFITDYTTGTGTITNAYGLRTQMDRTVGSIINGYGLYVGYVNATNGYGVYQASAANPNYFAGNIYAGNGIRFPAAQVASADANTLDDYEEGAWTPAISASTTAPTGLTYSVATGRYVKIGNTVFVQFGLKLTSKGTGGAGEIIISGLPFTRSSSYLSYANPTTWLGAENLATAENCPKLRMWVNSTNSSLYTRLVDGGDAGLQYGQLTDTTVFLGQLFYDV